MKWLGNCRESRFTEPLCIGWDSSACDVVRYLPPVQDGVCHYKVEPCSGVLNITIKSTIVVRRVRGRAAVATSAGQLPHKDRM